MTTINDIQSIGRGQRDVPHIEVIDFLAGVTAMTDISTTVYAFTAAELRERDFRIIQEATRAAWQVLTQSDPDIEPPCTAGVVSDVFDSVGLPPLTQCGFTKHEYDRECARLGAIVDNHIDDATWLMKLMGICDDTKANTHWQWRGTACRIDRNKITKSMKDGTIRMRKVPNVSGAIKGGWRVELEDFGNRTGMVTIKGHRVYGMQVPVDHSMFDFFYDLANTTEPVEGTIDPDVVADAKRYRFAVEKGWPRSATPLKPVPGDTFWYWDNPKYANFDTFTQIKNTTHYTSPSAAIDAAMAEEQNTKDCPDVQS